MNTEFEFAPNWDNDGVLEYKNAKTLKRYRELRDEQSHVDVKKFDVFFAFSNEQFAEGLKSIRPLSDGEKLVRIGGGGFGTKDGAKRLFEFYESIDAKIKAECDPQEVYVYEYNNHECCIAWDGDLEAIKIVLSLFGEETARKIKRHRASMTVDNLVRKPIKVSGLYFDYNGERKQPSNVWFSDIESEVSRRGLCHCMYDNVLYTVCLPSGEPYRNSELAGLTASYDEGTIFNYRKE